MNIHPILDDVLQGKSPNLETFVEAFGETLPLLDKLAETPQDQIWHGEGSVLNHTGMVLNKLYQILDRQEPSMNSDHRLALVLAAVTHDIAKPLCTRTREIDGKQRIVAPGHEKRGQSYLAFRLAELGLSFQAAQTVINLVAFHNLPKMLVTRSKEPWHYRRLARLADPTLLFLLELADMRGRICPDRGQEIENIEMFALFAKEYGVWGQDPYSSWRECFQDQLKDFPHATRDFVLANAIRNHESGMISMPEEEIARFHAYRESFPQLVIMCGPSGSGKSSWIHKNLPDHAVVSLDNIRERLSGKKADQSRQGEVLRTAREELKQNLRKHGKIVWDATNLRLDFRSQISKIGFDNGALVTIVAFWGLSQDFMAGNKNRDDAVSGEILRKQFDELEWPDPTEAHVLSFVDISGRTN